MAAPSHVTQLGIIGCGNISNAYIDGCRQFDHLRVVAVADIAPEAAQAKAAEHDLACAGSVEALLADPDIDLVINLTTPAAHAAVSLAVLAGGKHVYSEKPLAVERADGRAILAAAAARGLRVGGAPDTFLGGSLHTCRKLIDDGAIGQPVAATAFMLGHGPEDWHPNPGFYYKKGAGPLFDMGPYYLTALVHLLGPVERVAALARITFAERTATSEARYGEKLPVEVPTHVAGTLAMAAGPLVTMITSFDVWGHTLPRIEIYGSEGSLSVPDPNYFGGPVRLLPAGSKEWQERAVDPQRRRAARRGRGRHGRGHRRRPPPPRHGRDGLSRAGRDA